MYNLALPLLPHQEEAVQFVIDQRQAFLALDMGLGKTACAIAAISYAHSIGEVPALVIVPPSLRTTWLKELSKFAPHLRVCVVRGSYIKPLEDADVYIIGDSVIKHWVDPTDPLSLDNKIKMLVVDESHRVKNMTAARTRAVIKLAKAVPGMKILMSGTPTPNGRNQEIASQIEILGQMAWDGIGGKGKFWTYHCPIERDDKGRLNRFGKRASIDQLGLHDAMTSSFMMRKRRHEVLDLPNKGRSAIHIESTGNAVDDYLLAEEDLVAYLAGAGLEWRGAARNEALVKLTTMRRLAGECKVQGVINRVKEILNESAHDDIPPGIFVVAEHRMVMERITHSLHSYGAVEYNGSMDDGQKADAVEMFTSGDARVMVGQIKAAGVGLTLHGGGRNHHVIIVQLPWSPADIQQAEDRLHRIGQTADVDVEICIASINGSWTVDERLWSLLENKAFSAGELIDGKGEFLLEEIQDSLIETYR
jgi:SWI/SNF-related matrix-associated actin-dependent regulator 1 of chromatin subfamily A